MKALLITNELHWSHRWSSELGAHLNMRDSSNTMLIFEDGCKEQDILALIADAPKNLYRIVDLEQAAEEDFEFMADSGTCYRQLH